MAGSYYRYSDPAVTDGVARPNFPGHFSSEAPALFAGANTSNFLQTDINPIRSETYGVNDVPSIGPPPTPSLGELSAGTSIKGYSSLLDDSYLRSQRPEYGAGITQGPIEKVNERPSSWQNGENLAAPASTAASSQESNMLFVDGLPTDCTRREVGHIFRPFIGFKDIRVFHKEARRKGDRAMVLSFVEFADSRAALTAMEALQGYKFDDKKPVSLLKYPFCTLPILPPF